MNENIQLVGTLSIASLCCILLCCKQGKNLVCFIQYTRNQFFLRWKVFMKTERTLREVGLQTILTFLQVLFFVCVGIDIAVSEVKLQFISKYQSLKQVEYKGSDGQRNKNALPFLVECMQVQVRSSFKPDCSCYRLTSITMSYSSAILLEMESGLFHVITRHFPLFASTYCVADTCQRNQCRVLKYNNFPWFFGIYFAHFYVLMKRNFICLDDQSIKGTIFLVTVKTH